MSLIYEEKRKKMSLRKWSIAALSKNAYKMNEVFRW
jgi:hypothetical protein